MDFILISISVFILVFFLLLHWVKRFWSELITIDTENRNWKASLQLGNFYLCWKTVEIWRHLNCSSIGMFFLVLVVYFFFFSPGDLFTQGSILTSNSLKETCAWISIASCFLLVLLLKWAEYRVCITKSHQAGSMVIRTSCGISIHSRIFWHQFFSCFIPISPSLCSLSGNTVLLTSLYFFHVLKSLNK